MKRFATKPCHGLALAIAIASSTSFGAAQAATDSAAAAPAPAAAVQQGAPMAPPDGTLPPGPPPDGMMGQPPQQEKDASSFSARQIIDNETKSLSQQHITATQTDENAVLVRNGGKLTLTNSTLHKVGDSSSADASNFSGQNAVLLAADSTAVLKDLVLTSDADGSNAVFATGSKSHIKASHLTIHTKNNSSRGLDATYDGTIEADHVDITTEGAHCGALATDRGEGTVIVKDAVIRTSGQGSPCVYSTGDIRLTKGTGEATGSEIAVVEGKNSITLDRADLTGHVDHGVMLYQSFSGDAGIGEAHFTAKDSTLNNKSDGPMFFITNTRATASLERTALKQSGDVLVNVTSSRWGKTGANGGDFTLNAKKQTLAGKILANKISKVKLALTNGSSWRGSLNEDQQAASASISLDRSSRWELTADSYVTSISDKDATFANIKSNGHSIYYDASQNSALAGRTINLPGGGKLMPQTKA